MSTEEEPRRNAARTSALQLRSRSKGAPRGTRFEDQRAVAGAEVLVAQAVEAAMVEGGLERVRGARPGDVQPAAEIGRAPIRQAKLLDQLVDGRRAIQSLGVHLASRSSCLDFSVGVLDNQGLKECFDLQFSLFGFGLRLRFRPIRQIEEIESRQTRHNGELNRHQPLGHRAAVRRFHGVPANPEFPLWTRNPRDIKRPAGCAYMPTKNVRTHAHPHCDRRPRC
ncbi:hypothetical protein SBA2_270088 [Acidobacteriia bacterium SbA2]|nr:hypothetical protein SBA2_270088 [Acidobacteriia bacterium SbA2]